MAKQSTTTSHEDGTIVTVLGTTQRFGIAGQVVASARVLYVYEGDSANTSDHVWQFSGSLHGGPVVLVGAGLHGDFVTEPSRFGEFATNPREWARRFVLNENVGA